MVSIQKDKMMGFVGLGLAAAGVVLFLLSLVGSFEGMMYLMGFFLGGALVLCGLIMAGVYFWRWGRIQKLFRGDSLMANWSDDGQQALIASNNAYVDGVLYEWAIPGTRLEDVCITPALREGGSQYLEIALAEGRTIRGGVLLSQNIWTPRQVRVRIPAGQEAAAARIVAEIMKHNK
ncbi:MAG: hypothetical protein AB9891_03040 [Anaerolineaceae bacterium]